jgi:hypothetical protein
MNALVKRFMLLLPKTVITNLKLDCLGGLRKFTLKSAKNPFNYMASVDVKNPCGEFEQRQRIIHFAAAESRKLSL